MTAAPSEIVDFEIVAQAALAKAQFCFSVKPLSVNDAYMPVRKGTHADTIMTSTAVKYKTDLYRMIQNQKLIHDWVTHDRFFSMWVIVDKKYNVNDKGTVLGGIDIDNCHKLIQDAFCAANALPNDKYAMDTRQMYADFSRSSHAPKNAKFCVLIRWGDPIPSKNLQS